MFLEPVRPLYYYYENSIFVFATDYRAILALPFIKKKINEVMLYRLLNNRYVIDQESTYFESIKRLQQAHLLKVEHDGIEKYKYWTLGSEEKIHYETEEEYFKALYNVVSKAIKSRIDAVDCNIGAQMSGGLDSSVITILANRELDKKNKKLTLFSWSPTFEEIEKQPRDERNFIEEICKQEGLKSLYYNANKENDSARVDKEEPIDLDLMNPFHQELESMSAEGVRCVLTGWGGDQGISHRVNLFELFLNGYWSYFFKEAYGLSSGSILKFSKIIISNTILQLFRPFGYFAIGRKNKINITNKDFDVKMKKYNKRDILYFNVDPIKHIESGNIQNRTEMSAWLGAEYNIQYIFPFLDYNVVQFAMSIPRHMYYKNGINRYVYRKAFENILPKELCYYTYKDEVAKMMSFRKRNYSYRKRKILKNSLDRYLFSEYIDFNKVEKILSDENDEDEVMANRKIKRKINVCYNIQKTLRNAEKIAQK